MSITQTDFLKEMSRIFEKANTLVTAKNKDYATDSNPFKSFAISEALGYSVEESILIRMGDKLARLTTLLKKSTAPEVNNESIEDTLLDLVVYPAIALAKRNLTINEEKHSHR